MAKSIAELKKLINLARKSGLKSITFDGVSLQFEDSKTPATATPTGSSVPLASDAVMPRDDELLYASSPYYDQLKSQREEANKPQEN